MLIESIKFSYTGAVQTYTIPSNVNQVTVELHGGQGGKGSYPYGGKGAFVMAKYSVTSGQVWYLYVAGGGGNSTSTVAGTAGFNGGAAGHFNGLGGGGGGAKIIFCCKAKITFLFILQVALLTFALPLVFSLPDCL